MHSSGTSVTFGLLSLSAARTSSQDEVGWRTGGEFYEVTPFPPAIATLNRELLAWERAYNAVRPAPSPYEYTGLTLKFRCTTFLSPWVSPLGGAQSVGRKRGDSASTLVHRRRE